MKEAIAWHKQNLVLLLHDNEDDQLSEIDNLNKIRQAAEQIRATLQKAKLRFDSQHSTPRTYEVEYLVFIRNEAPSQKLEPHYKRLSTVSKVFDKHRGSSWVNLNSAPL